MHLTSPFCIGGGLRACWLKRTDYVWGCQPQKQLAIDLKMPKLELDIHVLKEIDLAGGSRRASIRTAAVHACVD